MQTYGKDPSVTDASDWYYKRFSNTFEETIYEWKPDEWAQLFRDAGARYVVLTSKHHDGYCLWPSQVPSAMWQKWAGKSGALRSVTSRDVVGELTRTVRRSGMEMGLYYSGGYDWSWDWEMKPCASGGRVQAKTVCHPHWTEGKDYAAYAGRQLAELIAQYKPAILWDDINWPDAGKEVLGGYGVAEILSRFYQKDCPQGVVNNRWHFDYDDKLRGASGRRLWRWSGDFGTPEYSQESLVQGSLFETCRGIGESFGYNSAEDSVADCGAYLSARSAIDLLVNVTASNGNLLLDVGPDAKGKIPSCQADVLRAIGRWLRTNGDAVYEARPWLAVGKDTSRSPVRFTFAPYCCVFAIVLSKAVKKDTSGTGLRLNFERSLSSTGSPLKDVGTIVAEVIVMRGTAVSKKVVRFTKSADETSALVFVPWSIVPYEGERAWVMRFRPATLAERLPVPGVCDEGCAAWRA